MALDLLVVRTAGITSIGDGRLSIARDPGTWGRSFMKAITREWISKAEGDWNGCRRLIPPPQNIRNYDGVCFHTQQCAEKHLKGRLEEAGIAFGKTHDLARPFELDSDGGADPTILHQDAISLTDFAVDYRYPGSSATKTDAKESLKRCGNMCERN